MDYKDTIDTTHDPYSPKAYTPDASTQDSGSTDSNSPYSLRNHKFAPYSDNTMKTQKNKENKLMVKLQYMPPLTLMHLELIPPILTPKILSPLTPIPHIHWEIANLPPTPPLPWKT